MTTTDPTSRPSCPHCGTPLAADAPEGLCPRCLAAANFGDATLFTGDGAALPPPPVEEIAPHFPQLEILSCLGRGGMGVVYKARQISLDRLVALKLLAPEREKDPEFSERFAREAHALARMSHPNIVTVHDFGQAGGFFYLLMEFVDGANLRQLLQTHKFTPEQALGVVPPLCDALQYAHDRGIVHRDIKPENLLMDREGKLKVADFGLAKMLDGGIVSDDRPMGTPNYMAPEQADDPAKVDSRADIYSLGVVIYEMLTGELPHGDFQQAPSATPGVDARLDAVVHRAMEREPSQRYQQASILKTEVEKITHSTSVMESAPPALTPSEPGNDNERLRRSVKMLAIAMMVAAGLTECLQLWLLTTVVGEWMGLPSVADWFMRLPVLLCIPTLVAGIVANLLAVVGANRMRRMECHSSSVAAAVVLIASGVFSLPALFSFPPGGFVILAQLGAAIWGLVVLMRDDVKSEFPNLLEDGAALVNPQEAGRKVSIPSFGLLAAGALNLLFAGMMFIIPLSVAGPRRFTLMWVLLVAVSSVITLMGAWRMRFLKDHTLAIAAAVLAIITPPGMLIGLVFGIRALVVLLSDRNVKASFQADGGAAMRENAAVAIAPGLSPSAFYQGGVSARKGRWIAGGVLLAMILLGLAMPVVIKRVNDSRERNNLAEMLAYMDDFRATQQQPANPSTPEDLQARYDATGEIKDYMVRYAALGTIARDAAASGNVSMTRTALSRINEVRMHDETSRTVALQLTDLGLRGDALLIAAEVQEISMRDQVLAEVAVRKAPPEKSAEATEQGR